MRRVTLLVPAVLALAVACSPDGRSSPGPQPASPADARPSPTDAAARLMAAPGATVAAGTAATHLVATITGVPGRPDEIRMEGPGQVDFVGARASSILDLSELFSQPAAAADARFETVLDGGVAYVRSPLLSSLVGVDTPWLRVDPAAAPNSSLAPLTQLAGSDHTAPLALLAGVDPATVREVGPEELDGETNTHLAAVVDLRRAVEAAGPVTDPAGFERFVATLGGDRLEVDVYLDTSGRVRLLRYAHSLGPGAGTGRQSFELRYFDFGAAVAITVPPAELVTDLTETSDVAGFGDRTGGR